MWTVGFFGFFCFVGLGDGTVFIGHRKDDDDFNWHHCEFIYWQIYIYICLCRYRMYILPVCCIYFMSSSCPKISFGVKESHWSEQACTGITFPPHDLILHHFAPTSCTNRIALIPLFKKKKREKSESSNSTWTPTCCLLFTSKMTLSPDLEEIPLTCLWSATETWKWRNLCCDVLNFKGEIRDFFLFEISSDGKLRLKDNGYEYIWWCWGFKGPDLVFKIRSSKLVFFGWGVVNLCKSCGTSFQPSRCGNTSNISVTDGPR